MVHDEKADKVVEEVAKVRKFAKKYLEMLCENSNAKKLNNCQQCQLAVSLPDDFRTHKTEHHG